jgi:type II secretory pathway pseudopilin PulG
MRRANAARQRGFSVFELTIGIALVGLVGAGTAEMLRTSSAVAAETRSALRAEQECLRNLNAVKNVLRSVSWTTLSGFSGTTATAPSFQRVVSMTPAGGRVLGGVESVEWRASATDVDGVTGPGDVVLVSGGTETVLARQVIQGGFQVVREGYLLRIRLSTYAIADRVASVATRESAVSVRN